MAACGDLASSPQSAAKPRLIKPPAGKASSSLIKPHQQGHQASSCLVMLPAGKVAAGAYAEIGDKGEAGIEELGSSAEIKGDHGSSAEIKGDQGSSADIKGDHGSSAEIKGDQGSSADIKGDHGSNAEIKGDQGSSAEIKSEVKAAVASGTGTFASADWSAIPSAEDLADFARGVITLTGPMY